MFREFRDFLARGNVVDLAVAVVMGAAFGTLVTGLVKDFITPLVVAIVGRPDFQALTFTFRGSRFLYGDFINAVLSFLFIAAGVFFLIVKPMNALTALRARGRAPEDPSHRQCPECLSDIPVKARRCAFCTSAVEPAER